MTLKKCNCGSVCSTKNIKKLAVTKDHRGLKVLWFNCKACQSTLVLVSKKAA